jgi:hypothetical protein
MSDLISKNETIDLLYQVFEKYSMATDKNSPLGGFGVELFKNIKAMPTIYSVDKVVEELEKAKTINVDVGFGTICKAIRKDVAIEIVKAGGNS